MISFYINLDTAQKRRDFMERQFSEMGIATHRISAVTIEELSKKPNGIEFGNRMGRPWLDGEKATFLSHRECWKRIVEGNHDFGAIFEDDVHFSADAADFISEDTWIPPYIDVVKLETYLTKTTLSKRRIPAHSRFLHRLEDKHLGGAGYVLSRNAAVKLLSASTKVEMPVDHLIFDPDFNSDLSVWQLCDAICIQDDRMFQGNSEFKSQVTDSSNISARKRRGKMSNGAKILRELRRVSRQAERLAKNPARPFTTRRTVVEYS
jgi:Glycosyltransferase involved in LPS biosynthesis